VNQLPNQSDGQGPDLKAIWAIFGCILFFLLYQAWMAKKYPQQNRPTQSVVETTDQNPSANGTNGSNSNPSSSASNTNDGQKTDTPVGEIIPDADPDQLTIETDTTRYELSQNGGFRSIVLKEYKNKAGPDGQMIELLDSPLLSSVTTTLTPSANQNFRHHAERDGRTIRLWRQSGPFKVTQSFTFPKNGYTAEIEVSYENTGSTAAELNAAYQWQETINYSKSGGFLPGMPMERPGFVFSVGADADMEDLEGYCPDAEEPAAYGTNASINYLVSTNIISLWL
jgi:YidC/Oxa1 family membrane protein insertase